MAKRQKLDYNSAELTQDLKQSAGRGVDAFFPSYSPTASPDQSKANVSPVGKTPRKKAPRTSSPSTPAPTAPSTENTLPVDATPEKMVQGTNDAMTSRRHDVTTDVMTLLMQDINAKLWQEIIEEMETHNSSLRMSAREREQVEDVVRDLKRKYKIKTSMNEIARLGLLFLIHDFKKRGEQSIIHNVKKS